MDHFIRSLTSSKSLDFRPLLFIKEQNNSTYPKGSFALYYVLCIRENLNFKHQTDIGQRSNVLDLLTSESMSSLLLFHKHPLLLFMYGLLFMNSGIAIVLSSHPKVAYIRKYSSTIVFIECQNIIVCLPT